MVAMIVHTQQELGMKWVGGRDIILIFGESWLSSDVSWIIKWEVDEVSLNEYMVAWRD